MKHEELIKRLEVSCLGLDAVDPLRLLVDDVVAALREPEQEPVVGTKTWLEDGKVITQYLHPSDIYIDLPQRTWVGLKEEDYVLVNQLCINPIQAAEFVDRLLKEKNNG